MAQSVYSDCWTDSTCAIIANLYGITTKSISSRNTVVEWYSDCCSSCNDDDSFTDMGKLGDKISRKWMVLRALLGLAVCLFLMALCTAPLQFVLVRLLQGLFGGVVDASSAFASAEAPAEDRGKVLGRLQSSVSAGSLVGPLIGGVTASILGFSVLLICIAVITFIVCIFGALKLIETTHMPKSQTPNTNKGIRRSFQCLLCTQQTCRFIIVGVLANFAMYGMLTALSPLASSVNHTAIDDRSVIGFYSPHFGRLQY